MPDFDYYDPTPVTIASLADTMEALEEFDIAISDAKDEKPLEPFRYGSFYFNLLDNTNKQF